MIKKAAKKTITRKVDQRPATNLDVTPWRKLWSFSSAFSLMPPEMIVTTVAAWQVLVLCHIRVEYRFNMGIYRS